MISEQTILQAAQLLGEAAKPARVILFGSYARGDAQENSDLDFLVIEPELHDKFNEMVRLRQALRPLESGGGCVGLFAGGNQPATRCLLNCRLLGTARRQGLV